MLFCDIALAARIERAERQMLVDASANVRRRLPDVYAAPIGGGIAVLTEPGSPLNKVAGLGFAAFDELGWTSVEAEHARRKLPIQVELSTLADPAVARFLTGRGHQLVGVENVLGRPLAGERVAARAAEILIEACPANALDSWIDVMAAGFETPDTMGVAAHESYERAVIARVIRDFAAAAGVTLFLARIAGQPAGAAAMRLGDGVAQLSGAATPPAFRRRGVQSALLAFRIDHAARHGCELVVVTTQPGSKSQQNVMRLGFQLLYSRNVLRREA